MTAMIAPTPTALDDAIIKGAETALETVGRARDAIHDVIFGQEEVVDLAAIGRVPALDRRRAFPARDRGERRA